MTRLQFTSIQDNTTITFSLAEAIKFGVIDEFIKAGGTEFNQLVEWPGKTLLALKARVKGTKFEELFPKHDVTSTEELVDLINFANYLDAKDLDDYLREVARRITELDTPELMAKTLGLPYSAPNTLI